jgi:hypothetical protein
MSLIPPRKTAGRGVRFYRARSPAYRCSRIGHGQVTAQNDIGAVTKGLRTVDGGLPPACRQDPVIGAFLGPAPGEDADAAKSSQDRHSSSSTAASPSRWPAPHVH